MHIIEPCWELSYSSLYVAICYWESHTYDFASPSVTLVQGEYQPASEQIREALSLDPECRPALLAQAGLLEGRGELGEAIDTYKLALRLDEKDFGPWLRVGQLSLR